MLEKSPQADHFHQLYQGQAPWDVGHPQKALVDIAPRINGSVLDVGCGTGDNAIFFAQRGHAVQGVDFVAEAIERAKKKAVAAGVDVGFLVMDALALASLPTLFDNVVDSGLFHVFNDEDRARYVKALAGVLKPGGYLWLLCFSDREPLGYGPRRVSRAELHAAFEHGWEVLAIEPTRFDASADVPSGMFSEGGPRAFLAELRRQA